MDCFCQVSPSNLCTSFLSSLRATCPTIPLFITWSPNTLCYITHHIYSKSFTGVQPKLSDILCAHRVRIRQKISVSTQSEVISTSRWSRWINWKLYIDNNLHPCVVSGNRCGERLRPQKLLLVPIFVSRRLFILLKTLSNGSRRKIDRSVKLSLTLWRRNFLLNFTTPCI